MAPADNREVAYPVETQLALIRDIEEIHQALYGRPGRKGLVEQVEALAEGSRRLAWLQFWRRR